jgi:hypothetical protein
MDVVGSHMGRPKGSATMQTTVAQAIEHDRSAVSAEEIRLLVHLLALYVKAFRIGFR